MVKKLSKDCLDATMNSVVGQDTIRFLEHDCEKHGEQDKCDAISGMRAFLQESLTGMAHECGDNKEFPTILELRDFAKDHTPIGLRHR